MVAKVKIFKGSYRNQDVVGTFTLLKNWKDGARGGFVTVLDENGAYGDAGATIRVKCDMGDFEYTDGPLMDDVTPQQAELNAEFTETDDETLARLEKTFSFIPTMAAAAQKGQITALIISGPGGVGKSYGVESQLEKMNMTRQLAGKAERYELITGGCSTVALFKTLYLNRHKGYVTVFDDCDSILWDEGSLNLLKGALDTKPRRKISWRSDSAFLRKEDVPDEFVFEGSVIFLTNLKFDQVRSNKIAAHLEAIMSRAHYLDLSMDTRREQLLRIRQVVEGGMLDKHNLPNTVKEAVVQWVVNNQDYLTDLSLRTVVKCADLAESHGEQWSEIAEFTLLSHKGRIAKAVAERRAAV